MSNIPTPRQKYKQEYTKLIEHRKTLAFRSMGILSAIVAMGTEKIEGTTFLNIKNLVLDYNKTTEELQHIELLLDLMDHDDSSGEGNF